MASWKGKMNLMKPPTTTTQKTFKDTSTSVPAITISTTSTSIVTEPSHSYVASATSHTQAQGISRTDNNAKTTTTTTTSEMTLNFSTAAGEPLPSTSRGIMENNAAATLRAPGPAAATSAMTRSTQLKTPENPRELPAEAQQWLNRVAAFNGTSALQVSEMKFEGFFYAERVKSFTDNKWPVWTDSTLESAEKSKKGGKKKGKKKYTASTSPGVGGPDLCTAHNLAMAGFIFNTEDRTAKCFICHRRKSIDEFINISDPWELHQQLYSDCPFLKLGKRSRPDDYLMKDVLMLMGECEAQRIEYGYLELEKMAYAALDALHASAAGDGEPITTIHD